MKWVIIILLFNLKFLGNIDTNILILKSRIDYIEVIKQQIIYSTIHKNFKYLVGSIFSKIEIIIVKDSLKPVKKLVTNYGALEFINNTLNWVKYNHFELYSFKTEIGLMYSLILQDKYIFYFLVENNSIRKIGFKING